MIQKHYMNEEVNNFYETNGKAIGNKNIQRMYARMGNFGLNGDRQVKSETQKIREVIIDIL